MFKPSFFKGALAIAACSLIFSACGDDSGSNASADGKDDVVSEKKTSSSSSSVIPSSDPESSSSSKKASSSSSKKASSSSSKGEKAESSAAEDKGEELVREDFSISGFSQKGPFISGTTVIGQELDGKTLKQTGRSFRGKINNDKGEFDISSVSLASQYVIIDATGYYLNEVTGSPSKSTITLNALVDLSDRNTVNVNLLTHLEYERVARLVADGKEIADAKKQAQKEIFKAFAIEGVDKNSEDLNIFGESDNAAALLAVSVLMQGDRSEGELTGLLTDFANDLKKDGSWDDDATKGEIADWAMRMDLSGKLATVRENVEGWKLGKVPNFEKFVTNYWVTYYDVGECTKKKEGEQVEIKDSENVFVCNEESWKLATVTDGGLVYVSFDESEKTEKTIFDELDRSKIGVGDIWDYTRGEEVDLGEDGFSGWWYLFNDNSFVDGSSIYLNSKGQYEQNMKKPSITSDEGIKADKGIMFGFQLFNAGGGKSDLAYIGGAFDVMDTTGGNRKETTMDVTSWKGLCFVYSSTVPVIIRLMVPWSVAEYFNQVVLPASKETRLLNLPWKSFKYANWVYEKGVPVISIEDAVKNFEGLVFLVSNEDSDNPIESGAVYIKAVGKYNGCSTK